MSEFFRVFQISLLGDKSTRTLWLLILPPTLLLLAMIESRLSLTLFLRDSLIYVRNISRNLWASIFEILNIEFSFVEYQFDLLSLVLLSLFSAYRNYNEQRLPAFRSLFDSIKYNRIRFMNFTLGFVSASAVFYLIAFQNLSEKWAIQEGRQLIVSEIMVWLICVLFMLVFSTMRGVLTKKWFWNINSIFSLLLFYVIFAAFLPTDFISLWSQTTGEFASSELWAHLIITAVLSMALIISFVLSWRTFLRILFLIAIILTSDVIVQSVRPYLDYIKDFILPYYEPINRPNIEPEISVD